VGGLKGTGEELRAEEGKVVMDGEDRASSLRHYYQDTTTGTPAMVHHQQDTALGHYFLGQMASPTTTQLLPGHHHQDTITGTVPKRHYHQDTTS